MHLSSIDCIVYDITHSEKGGGWTCWILRRKWKPLSTPPASGLRHTQRRGRPQRTGRKRRGVDDTTEDRRPHRSRQHLGGGRAARDRRRGDGVHGHVGSRIPRRPEHDIVDTFTPVPDQTDPVVVSHLSPEGAGTKVVQEVEVDLGEPEDSMLQALKANYVSMRGNDVAAGLEKTLTNLKQAAERRVQ